MEALENHPLRTRDPEEADFFVVPIPVGCTIFWGNSQEVGNAYKFLFNQTLFQEFPEKHVVAFAETERVFGWSWWGLSDDEMKKFKTAIVVRDSDRGALQEWRNANNCHKEGDKAHQYFGHILSLGFGEETSNPKREYIPVTMDSWNEKKFWFFYHVREEPPFICNSTIYRHAFSQNSTRPEMLERQPVSIGFDIPPDEWLKTFLDSKFCINFRGDNPATRSFFHAIRAGCMPIIISDILPQYQALFTKSLQYDDFAVIVKEDDFLKDPLGSLNEVVSLSSVELNRKIEGLRLMQRIMATDQKDSLFVTALAREIVETMKEKRLSADVE